mgnify:CR=1 FL=1
MKELPEESGKIIIKPSKKADTRSAFGLVTEEELLKDTKSHISDVQRVSKLIADLLVQQCLQHDHTKIEYLDDFYQDFSSSEDFQTIGRELQALSTDYFSTSDYYMSEGLQLVQNDKNQLLKKEKYSLNKPGKFIFSNASSTVSP